MIEQRKIGNFLYSHGWLLQDRSHMWHNLKWQTIPYPMGVVATVEYWPIRVTALSNSDWILCNNLIRASIFWRSTPSSCLSSSSDNAAKLMGGAAPAQKYIIHCNNYRWFPSCYSGITNWYKYHIKYYFSHFKHKVIPILGAIPGIKKGGGNGGGIIKGGNIPVGVAAAAGGRFVPLAVASLDVAAPEEASTIHSSHEKSCMCTLLWLISSLLRGRGLCRRRRCSLWWRRSSILRWGNRPLGRRGCSLWRKHSRPHHVRRWKPYHIKCSTYIWQTQQLVPGGGNGGLSATPWLLAALCCRAAAAAAGVGAVRRSTLSRQVGHVCCLWNHDLTKHNTQVT